MQIFEWVLIICFLLVSGVIVASVLFRTRQQTSDSTERLFKSLAQLWEELEKDENYSKNPRIMKKLSELKELSKN